ncbi:MAG: hypothetical protein PHT79_04635 [Syntrophomonadaceae bacterium]|nr:hypothetical protein [Syntrophomonadaceae bacterium]MDD4549028.1 hypothetical protein [Syntrophomonadaceae bacterium]
MITSSDFEQLLDFPEPRRRTREIVHNLCEGKSLVWIFPVTIDKALLSRIIADECSKCGIEPRLIYIDDDRELPGNFVANKCSLPVSPGSKIDIWELMNSDDIPNLIILEGLDTLEGRSLNLWLRFIINWSRTAKQFEAVNHYYPKALLIPTNSYELVYKLQEDLFLKLNWFWGWFTSVELKLLIRTTSYETGWSYKECLWIETVFVELAGTDMELLLWLVNNLSSKKNTNAEIYNMLKKYGETKQWVGKLCNIYLNTDAKLHEPQINGIGKPIMPPVNMFYLWNAGAIDWSDKTGLIVNSALLAIRGDITALNHRIWRGQSKFLLPIIDLQRIQICHYLKERYTNWQVYCNRCSKRGNGTIDNPSNTETSMEFYEIVTFLRENRSPGARIENLRIHTDNLRKSRNILAHYIPLEFKDFSFLLDEIKNTMDIVNYHI